MNEELFELAARVGEALKARGLLLATAESCTGGWVAKACTDVPGSSHWFDRGLITYSNAAKQQLVGVSGETLERFGAVSEQTVSEMVKGALQNSEADVAVAISGIAGPSGGSPEKPVGMVWFAWMVRGGAPIAECLHFNGDREEVRYRAVAVALQGVLDAIQ